MAVEREILGQVLYPRYFSGEPLRGLQKLGPGRAQGGCVGVSYLDPEW